jgi:hypothetical protein
MLGTPGSIRRVVARRGKGKSKAKQTKAAKGKGAKRAADEDKACLDDSEVKIQVEELMRLDEEEEEGGPPKAAGAPPDYPFHYPSKTFRRALYTIIDAVAH